MAQLSIVVNYPGAAQPLETTLVSILENRPPDCEVIVVHDGSYADPYDLEGEVAFVYAARGSSQVEMLNAGLHASSGKILHLLDAGMQVRPDWWRAGCQPLLDAQDVASVAPLVVDPVEPNRLQGAGLTYQGWRRRVVGAGQEVSSLTKSHAGLKQVVGPTRQAAFYRRADVIAAGRFRSHVGDELADLDLALTLSHAGLRSVVATESVVCGELPVANQRAFAQGLAAERLFWRHARFLGWRRSLLAYPWRLTRDWLTGFWSVRTYQRLMGGLCACLEKSEYQLFREQTAHFQHLRRRRPLTRKMHGRNIRVDGSHQETRKDDPSIRVDAPYE